MHYYFIINPVAGGGRAKRVWDTLKSFLDSNSIVYQNDFTRYPGHATELVQKLYQQDVNIADLVVITVGGDGTFDEVMNGLMSSTDHDSKVKQLPTGIIPAGDKNYFANAYGIALQPLNAFKQIQSASDSTKIYIGKYHEAIKNEDGYFVSSWGLGFDAALLSHQANNKRRLTRLNFLSNASSVLYNQQPFSLMVQEKHHHQLFANTYLATCFNHPLTGNRQERYQQLRSPNLQLLVVERRNWLITIWTLWLLLIGSLRKSKFARLYSANKFHYTTTSLEFVQKDGIELGNRFVDVTIESVPAFIWQQSNLN